MQVTKHNHTSNLNKTQPPKIAAGDLQPRYIQQLNQLLATARRQNNRRVIFALSSLIARKQGIA